MRKKVWLCAGVAAALVAGLAATGAWGQLDGYRLNLPLTSKDPVRFSPAGQLYLIEGSPTDLEIPELRASSWPQQYPAGKCNLIPGGIGVEEVLLSPNFYAHPYNISPKATAVELFIKAKVKVQGGDFVDGRPEGSLYLAIQYGDAKAPPVNAVADAYATRRQRTRASSDVLNGSTGESTGESVFDTSSQINFSRVTARLERDPRSPMYGRFHMRRITSLIIKTPPFLSQGYEPYLFSGIGYPTVYTEHNVYLTGYYAP